MTDQSLDIGAYVDQNVQSIADLERLVHQYTHDPLPVANVFKGGSWELFDKVYAMSDSGSIAAEQQVILLDATKLICTHARPREVLLMVLEKLSGCSELFPFQLLLHAMMLIIANSDSVAVWKQGKMTLIDLIIFIKSLPILRLLFTVLDAIIRKASVLSTPSRLQTNEAMHSDDEEDKGHSDMHSVKNGAFVDAVLASAKDLVQR